MVKKVKTAAKKKLPKADVDVTKAKMVLKVVDAGLSRGVGDRTPGQMCVEAAVAYAYGEPHNDQPTCVDVNLASIKISANDELYWKNNADRARGLRRLAIAQLGSKGRFGVDRFNDLVNEELLKVIKPLYTELVVKAIAKATSVHDIGDSYIDVEDLDYDWQSNIITTTDAIDRILQKLYGGKKKIGSEPSRILCECMVQALIKMKMPGTKYLYLTEGKKAPKKKSRK